MNGLRLGEGGAEGGTGREREKEVGLITVPSVFVLRRIRQPYLPAIR